MVIHLSGLIFIWNTHTNTENSLAVIHSNVCGSGHSQPQGYKRHSLYSNIYTSWPAGGTGLISSSFLQLSVRKQLMLRQAALREESMANNKCFLTFRCTKRFYPTITSKDGIIMDANSVANREQRLHFISDSQE